MEIILYIALWLLSGLLNVWLLLRVATRNGNTFTRGDCLLCILLGPIFVLPIVFLTAITSDCLSEPLFKEKK